MAFILQLLGGKFGLPILVAVGVFIVGLFGVIAGQQWWIRGLEQKVAAARADYATAKANEAVALAANRACDAAVSKVNDRLDALVDAERESGKRIAEALARVQGSAARLLTKAQEIANRPLPADPRQDCSTLETEIRDFLREAREVKP